MVDEVLKVQKPENCAKNIFRDTRTSNNVLFIFLDVKVLTERFLDSLFGV